MNSGPEFRSHPLPRRANTMIKQSPESVESPRLREGFQPGCWVWLLTLLLILLPPGPAHAEGKHIKIGLFAPLTGPDQPSGSALLEGATLAIEQVNRQGGVRGIKLRLVAKDEASGPTPAGQVLRDLAEKERCLAAIGSTRVAAVLASMPIANEKQIPLLVPNGSNEVSRRGNKWVFGVSAYDQLISACMASFAVQELKWRRIAILHQADEFGIEGMMGFTKAARRLGMTPMSVASFDRGERDFTIPISKILKKEPDGVVVWGLATETAHVAQQLRQMGYRGVIVGSPDLGNPQYIGTCGAAGNDTVFATPLTPVDRRPQLAKFLTDFQARFRYAAPSGFAASGYDAVMLVVKAIQDAKSLNRKLIVEALSNIKDYELTQGLYTFKASHGNGLSSLPLLIYLHQRPTLLHDQYRPDPRTLKP